MGNKIKQDCAILESYDMTLESVLSKAMWMSGEGNLGKKTVEEAFYHKINYDTIYDGEKSR